MRVYLYHKNDLINPYIALSIDERSTRSVKFMGEDIVTLDIAHPEAIPFALGDFVSIDGIGTFYLNTLPPLKKSGNRKYEYTAVFESILYDLGKIQYFLFTDDPINPVPQGEFFLMGNAQTFANLLITNLNRVLSGWSLMANLPSTAYKNLQFQNESCLSALHKICETFELEFITNNADPKSLIIGSDLGYHHARTFKYGRNLGLYELERKDIDSKPVITRLYPFGSERNIPSDYRNRSTRLKIAGDYVENSPEAFGVIEHTEIFEDIYPQRTGTISWVDGANIFKFRDSAMFDLNGGYLFAGTPALIHFQAGNLAGYSFEIISYTHSTREFVIKKNADEKDFDLPSALIKPAVGDTYVLLDIKMPQSYIDDAEARLLAKANEYLVKYGNPQVSYSLKIDPIYIRRNPIEIIPGDWFTVIDSGIMVNSEVRVLEIKFPLSSKHKIEVELAEESRLSVQQTAFREMQFTKTLAAESKKAVAQMDMHKKESTPWHVDVTKIEQKAGGVSLHGLAEFESVSIGSLGGYLKATAGAVSAVATIPWANIANKPSTYAPSAHNHAWGDITSGIPSTFTPSSHALLGTGHTVSGLTSGYFLRATGATTFDFGALTATDVKTVINDWFEYVANSGNPYLRVKLPIGCDGDVQAFTNNGQFAGNLWDSLPIASATTLGGIKVGTNLSINPTTGVLSATGGVATYPNAGIVVSIGSAWGTSITDASANWNTAYNHSQSSHAYLPLAGGTMSNTNLVSNLNADLLDGLNSISFPYGNGNTGQYDYANYTDWSGRAAFVDYYNITTGAPTASAYHMGMQYVLADNNYGGQIVQPLNSNDLFNRYRENGSWGTWNLIYSSANSNRSTVDWTVRDLEAFRQARVISTSAYNSEYGQLKLMDATNTYKFLYLGYDKNLGTSGSGYIQAVHQSNAWTNLLLNPNGGNIGISNTSPTQKLTIGDGTGTGNQYLRINSSATDIYIGQSGSGFFGLAANSAGNILSDNANYPLAIGTIGNQPLIFGTYATENMRILTNGNVGVNTTNPTERLHVVGNIKTYGAAGSSLILENGAWYSSVSSVVVDGWKSELALGTAGGVEKVRVTYDGKMGIGTTSPNTLLELASGTAYGANTPPVLRLTNNKYDTTIDDIIGGIEFYSKDADGAKVSSFIKGIAQETYGRVGGLSFGVSQTYNADAVEAMRIDYAGRVGIGTTAPASVLHTRRYTATDRASITRVLTLENNSGNNPYTGFGTGLLFRGTTYSGTDTDFGAIDAVMEGYGTGNQISTGLRFYNIPSFAGGLTETMRIIANGNVCINESNVNEMVAKLHVNGNVNINNGYLRFGNGNAEIAISSYDLLFKTYTAGVGLTEKMRVHTSGNVGIGRTAGTYKLEVEGAVYATGNIYAGGEVTAYYSSDSRLKRNINDFSSLDLIDRLFPKTFYWNEIAKELNSAKDDSLQYGLIAQEVESVMPELVHTIFGKYKSVDYISLIPILLQAVKELKAEVNTLKNG